MPKCENKVALVCKLMPLYRLGVFQKLSTNNELEFTIFGDTKKQGGIEIIDWEYSRKPIGEGLRWVRTKNYFYKTELLLWQTGILKNILSSNFKVYIFEGAVSQLPVWLYAMLCKLFNKKVLLWTHGFKGTDRGIIKIIRSLFFKHLADGLLLYGHHQKEIMKSNKFDSEKLFVIYNSLQSAIQFKIFEDIDVHRIKEEKFRLFKHGSLKTIIFIGRLVKQKGVLEIIKACNYLNKTDSQINCIFIGDGTEKETLNKYAKENSIEEYIHFTGSLYNEVDIARYFAMADLMVSPGNVGLNCIHSLAYGVPVLTHNNFKFQNPEVEAIVEGETGIFFKYGDYEDLILKIKVWINLKNNKETVKNKCQAKIKDIFNPENHANCIAQAVQSIIDEK